MSLARTALRLQAIEILTRDVVLAPLLAGRVFDSRIGAIDHREACPLILVTTEETTGEGFSANNGGAPFDLTCDLVLEIAMSALDGAGDALTIGYVGTDRGLEAILDLIEDRAVEILTVGDAPESVLLRREVTRRVPKVSSSRFATDQTGEKLGVKLVTLRVALKGEDQIDATRPETGSFATLPGPLRAVCRAAAPGSSVRETCDLIAAALTGVPLNPFLGADIIHAPQSLDPAVTPNKAGDVAAGRTLGQSVTLPDWTEPHA